MPNNPTNHKLMMQLAKNQQFDTLLSKLIELLLSGKELSYGERKLLLIAHNAVNTNSPLLEG